MMVTNEELLMIEELLIEEDKLLLTKVRRITLSYGTANGEPALIQEKT